MVLKYTVPVVGMALVAAVPASAHHSFASYDMSQVVSASGTIKEFRWGAPHSSLVLVFKDKSGKPVQMSLISGGPLMFSRQGFAPRNFHSGDKVTVSYHPTINGMLGGSLATLTLPGGKTFTDTEAAAIASPGK